MKHSDLHVPVMLQEVVDALAPKNGQTFLDATFGNGGYSQALLEKTDCNVTAFDRDPDAIKRGQKLVEISNGRLELIETAFGDLSRYFGAENQVDGIVFDLGVCSTQLDEAERGFSFRLDGPLDMRMEQKGPDAAAIVNSYSEEELADILWRYGEEKASRRIARAIIKARGEMKIERTSQLCDIIHGVMPRPSHGQPDSATRAFQALRIYINKELEQLEQALEASPAALKPGGILVVVSFHSLEDRIVKQFLRERSGRTPNANKYRPQTEMPKQAIFKEISRKPVLPTDAETAINPRARSAKLRMAIRTDAPVPTDDHAFIQEIVT